MNYKIIIQKAAEKFLKKRSRSRMITLKRKLRLLIIPIFLILC